MGGNASSTAAGTARTAGGAAASADTSKETEQQSINLLLCGPTGTGKSATGNNILKRNVFEVDDNDVATTRKCKEEHSQFKERDIKVMDTPGLDNVEATREDFPQTAVGYDAVLLTIRYGRLPNYTEASIENLRNIYGKNVLQQRGILVITYGDEFIQKRGINEDIFRYCSDQTGLLKFLWEECNKRVVLFDNVTKDPEELEFQRKRLFDILLHKMKTKRQLSWQTLRKIALTGFICSLVIGTVLIIVFS